MTNLEFNTNERISSLLDGDLHGDELSLTLDALLEDPQSMQTWHTYQVVGDVMRSAELAPARNDFVFLQKLQLRLASEPSGVGGPANDVVLPITLRVTDVALDRGRSASNAPAFRWKALAGVSCVALVGLIGASMWTQLSPQAAVEVAMSRPDAMVAPTVVATDTVAGPMLRDPRLDELMAAHRQLGGHSALQVPAGFLRDATYEGARR